MAHTTGEPLYTLRGLVRSHGSGDVQVRAIDRLDLDVESGEFVVMCGPSGSGKTTLLQLLGALDRPSDGLIEFEGHDLGRLSGRQLADLRLHTLGFVFQQFNLIPTLTARENVEVALAPLARGESERRERAAHVLHRVGLDKRAGHLPSQLSGGEQQRVAIARALANEPRVLLGDEPTGNLDTASGETILALLRQLWEETSLTVILNTHDEKIAAAAPRVLRLADGRLMAEEGDRARPPAATRLSEVPR